MAHFWTGISHFYATPAHSCHPICTRNKSTAAATVPPCHVPQTTTSLNRNKTGNERTTNNVARSYNHCCSAKATSIKYSKCLFVALSTPHAMRMRRMSSVTCLVLPYCSTLSHKWNNFREKLCSDFLSKFETFFIVRIHQGSTTNAHRYSCTVASHYSCQILNKSARQSFENAQISNFLKIRPVGAELLHADRQPHQI
jgi:hypothetical protein